MLPEVFILQYLFRYLDSKTLFNLERAKLFFIPSHLIEHELHKRKVIREVTHATASRYHARVHVRGGDVRVAAQLPHVRELFVDRRPSPFIQGRVQHGRVHRGTTAALCNPSIKAIHGTINLNKCSVIWESRSGPGYKVFTKVRSLQVDTHCDTDTWFRVCANMFPHAEELVVDRSVLTLKRERKLSEACPQVSVIVLRLVLPREMYLMQADRIISEYQRLCRIFPSLNMLEYRTSHISKCVDGSHTIYTNTV